MGGHFGHILASEVGDHRHAEHAHAGMVGHDDFGNGGHAHGITADHAEVFIFGRSLERRAGGAYIDAVHHTDVFLSCDFVGQSYQFVAVGFGHGRESRTEAVVVLATERIFREEVDMVGDDHHVANAEFLVHTTGCIADKEGHDAEFAHHADWECHLLHVVAFVVVEATLHGHYWF